MGGVLSIGMNLLPLDNSSGKVAFPAGCGVLAADAIGVEPAAPRARSQGRNGPIRPGVILPPRHERVGVGVLDHDGDLNLYSSVEVG